MKKGTKWIIAIVVILLALFGSYKAYNQFSMGGTDYYVQVTNGGQRYTDSSDSGKKYISYRYNLPGYDKNGTKKQLSFTSPRDTPLKKGAYLKVTYNQRKGVTRWEQVKQSELPNKAEIALD